jgi:hypothetical protein
MSDHQTAAGIQIGHRAIWVHAGDTGECLGRFGVYGIDVHRRIGDQCSGQCLDCTHNRTTADDWNRFQRSMLAYHGVDLSHIPMPSFVQDQTL